MGARADGQIEGVRAVVDDHTRDEALLPGWPGGTCLMGAAASISMVRPEEDGGTHVVAVAVVGEITAGMGHVGRGSGVWGGEDDAGHGDGTTGRRGAVGD